MDDVQQRLLTIRDLFYGPSKIFEIQFGDHTFKYKLLGHDDAAMIAKVQLIDVTSTEPEMLDYKTLIGVKDLRILNV